MESPGPGSGWGAHPAGRGTAAFRAVSNVSRICYRKASLVFVGTVFAFDKQIFLCAFVKASYFLINIHLHA